MSPDLTKFAITQREKHKFDNLFKSYNTNYLSRVSKSPCKENYNLT